MEETVRVNFSDFGRTKDYQLVCDSNVHVHVSRIPLKGGYSLVTAYVINKRKNPANSAEAIMFQVELKAYAEDGSAVFIAEHICRKILASDEFYFEQRPIMGRGRGCAAVWETPVDGRTTCVKSAFIPEYEFPGVSAALDGFDRYFFSTFTMSVKSKKAETIGKLNTLAGSYENWINNTLLGNDRMSNPDFKDKIGNKVIERCQDALSRIREGIHIIETDDTSFDAFCFMNRVIFLQNSIKGYAKKHGTGTECNFQDFINPKNPDNNFGWRPFQIAFILMNLAGIVDPQHKDREIVDLLYFPTGGGKTEAYLGLMAFVIANRRLRATDGGEYNLDGGVTVMLRYTLRLLTTQQRDRITKMVIAAEMIRRQAYPQFGKEPISIGFWVGGGVTPNKFEEFVEKPDNPQTARSARNHVYKQLLTCPFCGKPLKEENFNINTDRKSIEIFCSDRDCQFYRYKNDRIPIPVYLVDEEIYPSRFITICEDGHMSDFPWKWWVHRGNLDCNGTLKMYSTGNTSTLADMWVECSCGAKRSMSGATQRENFEDIACPGHHPFRPSVKNQRCNKPVIPSQRGASNVYFAVSRSAISIPPWINPLYNLIDEHLRDIELAKQLMGDEGITKIYEMYFSAYTRNEFDEALERRMSNIKEFTEIKQMEYNAITHHNDPAYESNKKHFKAEEDALPRYLQKYFSRIIRVTRLREVRVLLGFTRVEAPDPDADEQPNVVALSKGKQERWLPAAEVNGEGIFIEFNKDTLAAWLNSPAVKGLSQKYSDSYREFCESKGWTITVVRNAVYVLMLLWESKYGLLGLIV